MSTKRVILANRSRLLREMLHQVINRTDKLEVVLATPDQEELPAAIERFDPAWVIASSPEGNCEQDWIGTHLEDYPSVRFILLSSDNRSIKLKWQAFPEEDLTNLSLKDFIHVLERDMQHT